MTVNICDLEMCPLLRGCSLFGDSFDTTVDIQVVTNSGNGNPGRHIIIQLHTYMRAGCEPEAVSLPLIPDIISPAETGVWFIRVGVWLGV